MDLLNLKRDIVKLILSEFVRSGELTILPFEEISPEIRRKITTDYKEFFTC